MKEKLNETKQRPSTVPLPVPRPEWGDRKDVQRYFGIRETLLYELDQAGRVESVSLTGKGKTRGKRLYNLASIRKLLRSIQQKQQEVEA